MPNADWWNGTAPPVERTRRAVVEHVWTVWKHGTRRMDCEIAAIERVGFEARFKENGEPLLARVPDARTGSGEADWKRRDRLAAGWLERLPMLD
jgi:hypothetical protein